MGDAVEIFKNKDVEAVFICTSTNTHVDYLKRSAQAGKAVYCEKPIGRIIRKRLTPSARSAQRRFPLC